MQMLLVEKLALTFVGDAYALATGFGKILVKTATAPIERIARACDVAGVLCNRRAKANVTRFHSSRHAPTSRRTSPRRCLFPFRSLNHLT
jgi:CRISPR/Cas system endoribonuclease Cas6 (RAMP superfamily)